MANTIDASLARIFANGNPEVGLEVGTDAGLSADEHIQIPRNIRRRVFYTTANRNAIPAFGTFDNAGDGWVAAGENELLYHQGMWGILEDNAVTRITALRIEPHTMNTIRAFIAANAAAVNRVQAQHLNYVHACRFWTVAGGFVRTNSSDEWNEVDNPDQAALDAVPNATVEFVANYCSEAFTAIAARGASWRKSNHATGGQIANGYPRRWMQKNGFFTTTAPAGAAGGGRALEGIQAADTTDFYIATHAAGVHPILALMAPGDTNHFAFIRPVWGMVKSFDIKESTRIRISEPTQVAGVAMVVDAYVVLQALVSEATTGLLVARGQVRALHEAREFVAANGIRCASYAQWFLARHPDAVRPEAFNQKQMTYSDLVGELASVAIRYFRNSTISQSQALANAESQLCSVTTRDLWTELGRNKQQATNDVIVAAWQSIRGGASAATLRDITSNDLAVSNAAITQYNADLTDVADIMGIDNAPTVQPRNNAADGE